MALTPYGQITINKFCKCGYLLETEDEVDMGMCDGCAIDTYERHMRDREQAYLEDDRNWPEPTGVKS